MREGVRNFMVGIVSIGGLIVLAALLMSFGELDRFTNPRYHLTLISSNAAGLRTGGGVEFNGVPVGVIERVYAEDDPVRPVRVRMALRDDVSIPVDVTTSVATPLIGGSALLKFTAPPRQPGERPAVFAKDGSATITADLSGGMFDAIASALDERMKPLMESLEKFNTLADTYTAVGENMNALLQPQNADAVAGGEPPNLRTAVVKINDAIDEATQGLRLAKEWLGDEQMRSDVRGAISKANQLIEQATGAVDRYTQLASSLETNAGDLTNRMLPAIDALAGALEDVRGLAAKADRGEGALGQMLNNPDLYNALTDAAIRLERTLVEAQLFIQKVNAEGLQLKLF